MDGVLTVHGTHDFVLQGMLRFRLSHFKPTPQHHIIEGDNQVIIKALSETAATPWQISNILKDVPRSKYGC